MRSGFVNFHEALEPLMTDINEIKPHPENYRNGDIDLIAESIQVNGYIAPIIAQKSSGRIIAGNHRYHALLSLGATEAPVIWIDFDDTEAKRYLVGDNHTSDVATNDTAQLLDLLDGLVEQANGDLQALQGTGYTENDLAMLTELNKIANTPSGDYAEWPTLTFRIPPKLKKAFLALTAECGSDDHCRFELLMRLAGWTDK